MFFAKNYVYNSSIIDQISVYKMYIRCLINFIQTCLQYIVDIKR